MAFAASHRATGFGIAASVTKAASALRDAVAGHRKFIATMAELKGLNDRELADMGITRWQIADVARAAVLKR